MNPSELVDLRSRIARLLRRATVNSGLGFSHSFPHFDGQTHNVRFEGVKSLDEFEDEILNAIVGVWNFKDYLKVEVAACGRDDKVVEALVNESMPLRIISDLANGYKHRFLKHSRSGFFARLKPASISVPQQAVSSITYEAFDVSINVKDPAKAEYFCRVESRDGRDLGDVRQLLNEAVLVWERGGLPLVQGV